MKESQYNLMLDLVQKYHAGQVRNNGRVPYWHHCDNVARLLAKSFIESGEGTEQEREAIILAACGHDLYEDTAIQSEEIVEKFGPELGSRIDRLIEEATNRDGDNNVVLYAEKIKKISEGGRLIKLADLFDNATSCAYSIPDNGVDWTRNFLLPTLTIQWEILSKSEFVEYRHTGMILKTLDTFAMQSLQTAIERA